MKIIVCVLLFIGALALTAHPQDTDWKQITEMSGDIPDHAGLTVETYASEIARGNDLVKLRIRFSFPNGAPQDMFQKNLPIGFDASSIASIEGRLEFNCGTLIVKPVKASAVVYQFNGRALKSKEPPFKIIDGHVFSTYFCERGSTPDGPPKLTAKPRADESGKSIPSKQP